MKKRTICVLITVLSLLLVTGCAGKKTQSGTAVYGKWVSEKGTLFEFSQDNRYGFYKDVNQQSDYYYKGPLEVLRGADAAKSLSIMRKALSQTLKMFNSSEENLFSVKMHMETLHSEGIDKSANLDKKGYYLYMFMISDKDRDKAVAFSISDDEPVILTRTK